MVGAPGEPRELTVDGERFRIRTADGGMTHCDWLSGPHPGYGLSIGPRVHFVPEGEPSPPSETDPSEEHVVRALREFLAQVDPATGYLD